MRESVFESLDTDTSHVTLILATCVRQGTAASTAVTALHLCVSAGVPHALMPCVLSRGRALSLQLGV